MSKIAMKVWLYVVWALLFTSLVILANPVDMATGGALVVLVALLSAVAEAIGKLKGKDL